MPKLAAQVLASALRKPFDEASFQKWAMENNVPLTDDYDMRGFYKGLMSLDPRAISSMNPNDQRLHYPDVWKLPNHKTFSTESQYYNPLTMPNTPSWSGGDIGNGQQSWVLRRPDGSIVHAESPWFNK